MRVLVNGGSGYIGSHTLKALINAGHYPVVLDNLVYGNENVVKNLYFSISENAQVVTDFNFKETNMELLKNHNLFLGNMSNVYPDERSINNAIKVGKILANLAIKNFN